MAKRINIMNRLLFLIILLAACQNKDYMEFDIQGHRGCRGIYPENTVVGFLHAIDLGVNTLEMDAVISKDNQVIISHEPFMSYHICLDKNGEEYSAELELEHNIYQLTYEELKQFDCGSKKDERYADRKNLQVHKPSLDDLVKAVKSKMESLGRNNIRYNIEIKRKPKWDELYHPEYKSFADLVVGKIYELGIMPQTTVQCFDVETLKYVKKTYKEVKLVYLIENTSSPEENIKTLGFIPEIYSPYHGLVDAKLVNYCKNNEMQLIPWTVNEVEDMENLIKLGVTGIISDYPDKLINLYSKM